MHKRFTAEEKAALIKQASDLRETRLSYKTIGNILNVSHSTIHRWLDSEANEKHKKYNRKYSLQRYHKNAEKERARMKKYYWANKNAFHERYKKNYAKSLESRKEYSRRYRKNNKEKIKLREQSRKWQMVSRLAMRRARKNKATPCWLSSEQKKQINAIYAKSCRLTRETGIKHEVDHIHPLNHNALCGLHVPWNLRIITKADNLVKSNKFMPDLGLTG